MCRVGGSNHKIGLVWSIYTGGKDSFLSKRRFVTVQLHNKFEMKVRAVRQFTTRTILHDIGDKRKEDETLYNKFNLKHDQSMESMCVFKKDNLQSALIRVSELNMRVE
jgi:hypothetical protein